jgi:hypothetical protein
LVLTVFASEAGRCHLHFPEHKGVQPDRHTEPAVGFIHFVQDEKAGESMSSEKLHAPRERLTTATLSHHHAIVSVMEEMDAIDWYRQRAEDTEDAPLREILLHNMREEVEHACMILEWLRRNDPEWSKQMDTYLYTDVPITEVEQIEEHGRAGEPARSPTGSQAPEPSPRIPARSAGRFTVGSLKEHGD